MKHTFLHTQDGLTVALEGKPYIVSSSHPRFHTICDLVYAGAEPKDVFDVMEEDRKAVIGLIKSTLDRVDMGGELVYEAGVITLKGAEVTTSAAALLVQLIELGHDYTALAMFIKNLAENPLPEIVNDLFDFLQAGSIPLTKDGCFLVYKAVRKDYMDIYSGKFLNQVGCVNEIPWEEGDTNRMALCSRGLHVCSYAYLPSFAQANGHVMLCKVNPKDVLAIPREYQLAKMRVCKYKVVGEVTEYYRNQRDIISEERLPSFEYEVWTYGDYADGAYTHEEAKTLKAEFLADGVPEDQIEIRYSQRVE